MEKVSSPLRIAGIITFNVVLYLASAMLTALEWVGRATIVANLGSSANTTEKEVVSGLLASPLFPGGLLLLAVVLTVYLCRRLLPKDAEKTGVEPPTNPSGVRPATESDLQYILTQDGLAQERRKSAGLELDLAAEEQRRDAVQRELDAERARHDATKQQIEGFRKAAIRAGFSVQIDHLTISSGGAGNDTALAIVDISNKVNPIKRNGYSGDPAKITYEHDDNGFTITIYAGYNDFYSQFSFDSNGSLIDVSAWE